MVQHRCRHAWPIVLISRLAIISVDRAVVVMIARKRFVFAFVETLFRLALVLLRVQCQSLQSCKEKQF